MWITLFFGILYKGLLILFKTQVILTKPTKNQPQASTHLPGWFRQTEEMGAESVPSGDDHQS